MNDMDRYYREMNERQMQQQLWRIEEKLDRGKRVRAGCRGI